jgi:hypothetical protein
MRPRRGGFTPASRLASMPIGEARLYIRRQQIKKLVLARDLSINVSVSHAGRSATSNRCRSVSTLMRPWFSPVSVWRRGLGGIKSLSDELLQRYELLQRALNSPAVSRSNRVSEKLPAASIYPVKYALPDAASYIVQSQAESASTNLFVPVLLTSILKSRV